ncbi:hypothetical protein J6590_064880 [Homalodisca vitripennis]|nr:hypothetical protein J6590_064880 [Homalodisca vitripennis]
MVWSCVEVSLPWLMEERFELCFYLRLTCTNDPMPTSTKAWTFPAFPRTLGQHEQNYRTRVGPENELQFLEVTTQTTYAYDLEIWRTTVPLSLAHPPPRVIVLIGPIELTLARPTQFVEVKPLKWVHQPHSM